MSGYHGSEAGFDLQFAAPLRVITAKAQQILKVTEERKQLQSNNINQGYRLVQTNSKSLSYRSSHDLNHHLSPVIIFRLLLFLLSQNNTLFRITRRRDLLLLTIVGAAVATRIAMSIWLMGTLADQRLKIVLQGA